MCARVLEREIEADACITVNGQVCVCVSLYKKNICTFIYIYKYIFEH